MTSTDLVMEIRGVDEDARTVVGRVAPYDETTYLVPDPSGERIARGAFGKSIRERETKIPLFVGHDHKGAAIGLSVQWSDDDAGLVGSFRIKPGPAGDETLADVRGGFLPAMSVGFKPVEVRRGRDGAAVVTQAKLLEVSLVGVGAYDGAQVLATRSAEHLAALLEPFTNPPTVDLTPFDTPWAR
jgi:hypothetical protein